MPKRRVCFVLPVLCLAQSALAQMAVMPIDRDSPRVPLLHQPAGGCYNPFDVRWEVNCFTPHVTERIECAFRLVAIVNGQPVTPESWTVHALRIAGPDARYFRIVRDDHTGRVFQGASHATSVIQFVGEERRAYRAQVDILGETFGPPSSGWSCGYLDVNACIENPLSTFNLSLTACEFAQNLLAGPTADVPLVAGRPIHARAYVSHSGPVPGPWSAALEVYYRGRPEPVQRWAPFDSPRVTPNVHDRRDLSTSLNFVFVIPRGDADQVERLVVTVNPCPGQLPVPYSTLEENTCGDNVQVFGAGTDLVFAETRVPKVGLAPITYPLQSGGSTTTDLAVVGSGYRGVQALFPVSGVHATVLPPFVATRPLQSESDVPDLLADAKVHFEKELDKYDGIVMFLPHGVNLPGYSGATLSHYLFFPDNISVVQSIRGFDYFHWGVAAHELYHALGRSFHSSRGLTLSSYGANYYGTDLGPQFRHISSSILRHDGQVEGGLRDFFEADAPIPSWILPPSWRDLVDRLQSTGATAGAQDLLRVRADLGQGSRLARLTVIPRRGELSPPVSGGRYLLRAYSGTGGTRLEYEHRLEPLQLSHGQGPVTIEAFVPRFASARMIERVALFDVPSNSLVLAKNRSANRPVVAVTSPVPGASLSHATTIAWAASDADDEALECVVEYSHDGTVWTTIGRGPNDGSIRFPADYVPASAAGAARIRVSAYDGSFHATEALVADLTKVGVVTPIVDILSPIEGGTFLAGDAVALQGVVVTLGADTVPDDGVAWTSDLQGALGVGRMHVVRSLIEGDHRITATARSASGGVASRSVILRVLPRQVRPSVTVEGVGCPGTLGVPGIAAETLPRINNPFFALSMTGAPALTPGLMVIGDTLEDTVWAPLCISQVPPNVLATALVTNSLGTARVACPVPNEPALVGARAFFQFYAVDARGAGNLGGTRFSITRVARALIGQ